MIQDLKNTNNVVLIGTPTSLLEHIFSLERFIT